MLGRMSTPKRPPPGQSEGYASAKAQQLELFKLKLLDLKSALAGTEESAVSGGS